MDPCLALIASVPPAVLRGPGASYALLKSRRPIHCGPLEGIAFPVAWRGAAVTSAGRSAIGAMWGIRPRRSVPRAPEAGALGVPDAAWSAIHSTRQHHNNPFGLEVLHVELEVKEVKHCSGVGIELSQKKILALSFHCV